MVRWWELDFWKNAAGGKNLSIWAEFCVGGGGGNYNEIVFANDLWLTWITVKYSVRTAQETLQKTLSLVVQIPTQSIRIKASSRAHVKFLIFELVVQKVTTGLSKVNSLAITPWSHMRERWCGQLQVSAAIPPEKIHWHALNEAQGGLQWYGGKPLANF